MKYVKILLVIGIVAILLFFFFKNVDFREVFTTLSSLQLIYPVVFLLGLYLQLFIRGYRWGIILKPHKDKIPLFTLYNYTMIGFFLNVIVPGKVGEAAKGILLAGFRGTGTTDRFLHDCVTVFDLALLYPGHPVAAAPLVEKGFFFYISLDTLLFFVVLSFKYRPGIFLCRENNPLAG